MTQLATGLLAVGSLFMAALPAAAQSTGLGYALSFDGEDDYVYVAPHPALDLAIGTIEFWVRPGEVVGNACILANRGGTAGQTRFSVHLATNAIGLFDGSALRTVPFNAVAGRWYHIALVCAGGDTEVLVDGISRGFTGNGFNTHVTGQPLCMGAARPHGQRKSDGTIQRRPRRGAAVERGPHAGGDCQ